MLCTGLVDLSSGPNPLTTTSPTEDAEQPPPTSRLHHAWTKMRGRNLDIIIIATGVGVTALAVL